MFTTCNDIQMLTHEQNNGIMERHQGYTSTLHICFLSPRRHFLLRALYRATVDAQVITKCEQNVNYCSTGTQQHVSDGIS